MHEYNVGFYGAEACNAYREMIYEAMTPEQIKGKAAQVLSDLSLTGVTQEDITQHHDDCKHVVESLKSTARTGRVNDNDWPRVEYGD